MHNTNINRMRIEEIEHVIDSHYGANDGCNPIGYYVNLRNV